MRQNPEDIDPDRYADDGELRELPEIPLVELERVHMEPVTKVVNPEIPIKVDPELGLQVPGEMVDIEGIHERIQSEMLNKEKENISRAEEILELPPISNEVQDLIMDEENSLTVDMRPEKQKREEKSRGRRKSRYEEDL